MITHDNTVPINAQQGLYNRMRARLDQGFAAQGALLRRVGEMVIKDKLVPPTEMYFRRCTNGRLGVYYGGGQDPLSIHRHALTQLAQKVSVPVTYINHLQDTNETWKIGLLGNILETSFHNTEFNDKSGRPRFLHRIVGNELRGFLSRRFNRHLASAPLLRAFMSACQDVGAVPLDATASDVKVALKCYLPHIFEPVEGEFICLGVEWSNSDFGAGRMQVALTVWTPKGDRFSVLDHAVSRVHVGSIIEDSDIEISEETAKKEAEAQASAIKDAVEAQLSISSIDRLLLAVKQAHAEEIPWHRLKGQLARFLSKKDIENLKDALDVGIEDLPPVRFVDDEPVPTKWWAMSALSWLANKVDDQEKKLDLQHQAGSFLEVK